MTIAVHHYLDWRAYLRAWLAARPSRTRARLATALGCAPSFVTALLHEDPAKRRALTDEYLERLPHALGLDEESGEFLTLLVQFDQADEGSETRERLRARIYADKRFREAHRASVEQHELFSRWENVAILALAESPAFQADPRWLREHLVPRIQLNEAARALALLLRLGLLRYDADGRVVPAHELIVSDSARDADALAMAQARRAAGLAMHRWMLERGQRALTEFSAQERYFNAGTQLVPESRLPELHRMFQRWQAEWMELCARPPTPEPAAQATQGADPVPPPEAARVYRLNLQFFPLTTRVKPEG